MTSEIIQHYGTGSDASALRGLCDGEVYLPGEEGYDQARTTWALAADLRPAAVAFPRNAQDVAEIVRRAAAAGLRIAPLGTGHNAYPLVDLAGSVLVRTNKMRGVRIDPANRLARAEAGVIWEEVVQQAALHGLAALHGSSPDAGVVGYSLGGGVSWYGRSLGLAANSVTAIEIVGADGTLVRVDAEREPELFWALRGGGGGSFGVVTAIEFELFPIANAYAGLLAWDWRDAHRILSRFAEWAPGAADEITTSYRHIQFPPIPQIPEPFRGRSLAMIDGAVLADDARAERLLAPLRELAPEIDTFARVPAAALIRMHMDPEGPTPIGAKAITLGALSAAAVDSLIEVSGPDSGSSLFLAADLRQAGGALGRPHAGGGAMDHFDGQYLMFCGGFMLGDAAEQTVADCERVVDAMRPYAQGRQYLNFQEERVDPAAAFDAGTWQRLRRIRATVDPGELFQANHEIPS
jgi:FAD/FMN-containing dehydrogenase